MVSSYRVDFQLCTEEAIQEALEELRLRGIECDRALYEDFDRNMACLSRLVDISEATGANDASSVESSIRQLHELSPGLEFFIDSRSFIRYAEQLVSAVILVADKPQICDMAFRILHSESFFSKMFSLFLTHSFTRVSTELLNPWNLDDAITSIYRTFRKISPSRYKHRKFSADTCSGS